jgi:GDP-L-fucose synthase
LELARYIAEIVGFTGEILTDTSKPDGTPRKLMDVGKIHQLGWRHHISLKEGIKMVYRELLVASPW